MSEAMTIDPAQERIEFLKAAMQDLESHGWNRCALARTRGVYSSTVSSWVSSARKAGMVVPPGRVGARGKDLRPRKSRKVPNVA